MSSERTEWTIKRKWYDFLKLKRVRSGRKARLKQGLKATRELVNMYHNCHRHFLLRIWTHVIRA